MRADIIVLGALSDGERFAVSRRDALEDVMFAGSLPWRPFAAWQQAFEAFCRSLQWLSEDDIRVQLVEMGFSAGEVDQQLERARSFLDADFTWERTTRIGFRNAYRQEVIRKTDLAGVAEGQRVYLLRCRIAATSIEATAVMFIRGAVHAVSSPAVHTDDIRPSSKAWLRLRPKTAGEPNVRQLEPDSRMAQSPGRPPRPPDN